MRGFSVGTREAQYIPVVFLPPQPLFRDGLNGCWQTRTSHLLSLLHTSSPHMTLYGNTHTPVGLIAAACMTTVFTRQQGKLLICIQCVLYLRYTCKYILYRANLLSALFIIKHQPQPHSAPNTATSIYLRRFVCHAGWCCRVVPSIITIIKSMPVNMSLELSELGVNDRSVEM